MGQGLSPGADREASLAQQPFNFGGGVKGRLAIKDTLRLMRQVVLAQRTVAINEADHQRSLWLEHPVRLGQHSRGRIDKTDRGDDECIIETSWRKWKG